MSRLVPSNIRNEIIVALFATNFRSDIAEGLTHATRQKEKRSESFSLEQCVACYKVLAHTARDIIWDNVLKRTKCVELLGTY